MQPPPLEELLNEGQVIEWGHLEQRYGCIIPDSVLNIYDDYLQSCQTLIQRSSQQPFTDYFAGVGAFVGLLAGFAVSHSLAQTMELNRAITWFLPYFGTHLGPFAGYVAGAGTGRLATRLIESMQDSEQRHQLIELNQDYYPRLLGP